MSSHRTRTDALNGMKPPENKSLHRLP